MLLAFEFSISDLQIKLFPYRLSVADYWVADEVYIFLKFTKKLWVLNLISTDFLAFLDGVECRLLDENSLLVHTEHIFF